jgi:hypothetical protein
MQNIVSLFSHSSCLFIHSTKSAGYRNISDLKANSAQQKFLSHSVWTCATQSPCIISAGKSGGTWMCIGVHLFASFEHPQKLIFSRRKGLDEQQTAFAVKK